MNPFLLAVCAVSTLVAADTPEKKDPRPALSAEELVGLQKWMAVAIPGAPRKGVAALAGTWTARVTAWTKPGASPVTSEGTSERKMVISGFFLEQRFAGNVMGQPFTGTGLISYDNVEHSYVSTGADDAGAVVLITVTEGRPYAAGKTVTYAGTIEHWETAKVAPIRSVVTMVDADHHTFEIWGPDQSGRLFKMMLVECQRRK